MENPCGLCLSENGKDLKTCLTYSGANVIFLLLFFYSRGLRPSKGFVFDSPRAHNAKFSCEILLIVGHIYGKRFIKVTSFENCENRKSEKRQGGRSGTCSRETEWDERGKV